MKYHLVATALVAACARTPAPSDPTERALFRDLERQVTIAAATGWGVDRLEVEGLLEAAFDSVCRVDALGFGERALRQRFLFPGAVLGLAYQRLFVAGEDLTTVKLDARVAFDWDL